MSQLELFPSPPSLRESAGEADRTAAKRRAWRTRQKRCRANKAWRAQLVNAPLDQTAGLARKAQGLEAQKARWSAGQYCDWIRAQNIVLGALMFGGDPARRALELVNSRAVFDERFSAIWNAMAALHERGALINERTVRAQLKRTGVLVLLDLSWLSGDTMPRPTVADVEIFAAFLNAVADVTPISTRIAA